MLRSSSLWDLQFDIYQHTNVDYIRLLSIVATGNRLA